jgi:hypothetical protein
MKDDEVREFLAQIYGQLQMMQITALRNQNTLLAIRKALKEVPGFEESYTDHFADEQQGPHVDALSANIRDIDEIIRKLRGL